MKIELTRIIDVFLVGAKKPLIVLLGPTASGKTGLSIEIAKHVNGEVVNADSRQLYQFLDIGTAKITKGEMHGIPHHLLSIKDPKEEVTAGKYQEWALAAIEDILSRKKVPILVGGSMLYIASITDGYEMEKKQKAAILSDGNRASMLRHRSAQVPPAVVSSRVDPSLACPELVEGSRVVSRDHGWSLGMAYNEQKKCSYDLLMIGVSGGREELRKRIARRVDEMMEMGWIEEVRDLLSRGYEPTDPGMESHGYREICEFLKELEEGKIEEEIEEAKERLKQRITTKTCQYAKRQLTWWRHDQRIHWVNRSER